jgi:hypothetical protein
VSAEPSGVNAFTIQSLLLIYLVSYCGCTYNATFHSIPLGNNTFFKSTCECIVPIMAGKYKYTKRFRKENPDYHKGYMLLRRRMYRNQYLTGRYNTKISQSHTGTLGIVLTSELCHLVGFVTRRRTVSRYTYGLLRARPTGDLTSRLS